MKSPLEFCRGFLYNVQVHECRCDGMVDVTDSKSVGGDTVWVRVPPPAPSGRNNLDILSAKLRVPGGCDLLFFKFSSCGEWIFSSNLSNWTDLNFPFPAVCGKSGKSALFQRGKQGKLPSKLYTKFRASVCWLSQSHQRGALFRCTRFKKGAIAHHTFTSRSNQVCSGLFFYRRILIWISKTIWRSSATSRKWPSV